MVVTFDPSPGDRVTAVSVIINELFMLPFTPVSHAHGPLLLLLVRNTVPPGVSSMRSVIFPRVEPPGIAGPLVGVVTRMSCRRQCLIGTGRPKLEEPYSSGLVMK
jgi:hypothetical protein